MARETLAELALAFPAGCYVELQRHDLDDERRTEPGLVDLAYELNPAVGRDQRMFSSPMTACTKRTTRCCASRKAATSSRKNAGASRPITVSKAPTDMRALFADLPEAIDNTLVIARRCSFLLKPIKPLLPVFDSNDEAKALRDLASEGLKVRLIAASIEGEAQKPYWDRLDFELNVITGMKFPGYFLIVADFIQWTKSQNIPVGPGRGSGAVRGRLGADHHRSGSVALRLAVRAVSQPRTRVDARLRHRLLPGSPRRGDPVCAPTVRRRSRRADHHLR